jgi:hypothetical protein
MKYFVGDNIIILEMVGESHYNNRQGKITLIDDLGQLHGTWGGLAVQPERDNIRKI